MFDRIDFEYFRPEHTELLFEIRNDPVVRARLTDSAPLDRARHRAWVAANLGEHPTTHLWFVKVSGAAAAGIVLVRDLHLECPEYGVMIRDNRAGGLGPVASVVILDHLFSVWKLPVLFAKVSADNARMVAPGLWRVGATEIESPVAGERHLLMKESVCRASASFDRLLRRFKPRAHIDGPAMLERPAS